MFHRVRPHVEVMREWRPLDAVRHDAAGREMLSHRRIDAAETQHASPAGRIRSMPRGR